MSSPLRTTSGSTGPGQVQPAGYCFVCNCERAAILATLPETIQCDDAVNRAYSFSAMQAVIDGNRNCIAAADLGNARAIRSLLGLRSRCLRRPGGRH
jgi:hypothetical protein